jgi:UDP-2,4-diacetamido-2,4,6-trideoxy-beta-L-altropyranose hydrolase
MSTWIFRCDGSPSLGMGHVRRCLVLGSALMGLGMTVCFVIREVPMEILQIIKEEGFAVERIPGPTSSKEPVLANDDRVCTEVVARKYGAWGVLIDHYGLPEEYFLSLRELGMRVAVIDDLGDRDLMSADWILNQNLGQPSHPYRVRPDCITLLGPTYALLRPEFASTRHLLSRAFTRRDRRVLVTLGGGDTVSLCSQIVSALNLVSWPLEVRCVFGISNPLPPRFSKDLTTSRHTIQILQNIRNMGEQMAWADLSINAGGSTCWELCCLGLPMIVLLTSPDQRFNGPALEKNGCALSLGEWNEKTGNEMLADSVKRLLENPERRAAMSSRARELVDGQGAARVALSLQTLSEQREKVPA